MRHLCIALLLSCFLVCPFDGYAQNQKAPVLVEVFSASTCRYDPSLQERLLKRVMEKNDVIVINCPKSFKGKDNSLDKFAHKYCDERSKGYFEKLMLFNVNTPMVIVNGVLEANSNYVDEAIEAARSLTHIQEIKLDLEAGALKIEVPKAIENGAQTGEIVLYAYIPTINAHTVLQVDPDLALDEKIKEDLRLGKSVPFVEEKRISNLKLRPVVGYRQVARWSGKKMNFSYPVVDLDLFSYKRSDLSFIAVLHEGNQFGRVIAMGEWKAFADIDKLNANSGYKEPILASFPK